MLAARWRTVTVPDPGTSFSWKFTYFIMELGTGMSSVTAEAIARILNAPSTVGVSQEDMDRRESIK